MQIEKVIYDAAARRFAGRVHLGKGTVNVSTPGHPSWGYRRIASALLDAAHAEQGVRHAYL